jgi:hypothetical protein
VGGEELKTGVFQITISGPELGVCVGVISETERGYSIRIKVEKAIKYTTARPGDEKD